MFFLGFTRLFALRQQKPPQGAAQATWVRRPVGPPWDPISCRWEPAAPANCCPAPKPLMHSNHSCTSTPKIYQAKQFIFFIYSKRFKDLFMDFLGKPSLDILGMPWILNWNKRSTAQLRSDGGTPPWRRVPNHAAPIGCEPSSTPEANWMLSCGTQSWEDSWGLICGFKWFYVCVSVVLWFSIVLWCFMMLYDVLWCLMLFYDVSFVVSL